MTLPTEDQIEAARTKVRNMLHAADHGNHLGEMAVLRMAASGELVEALREVREACLYSEDDGQIGVTEEPSIPGELFDRICAALSLAQPYEAEVEGWLCPINYAGCTRNCGGYGCGN